MKTIGMQATRWLVILMVCSIAFSAQAAGVRAWLDRDTVQIDETVTLNVEAQGVAEAQPDFSALKQDFDLLGTQSSQQISIVNGTNTSKTLWAVGLQPKHEGRITIAPIKVGSETTAPIELKVSSQPAAAQPQAGGDVFLEVSAEPLAPYVQQQVRYTLKLYYAFDMTNGSLGEPAADGVTVQRVGQDSSYTATVGARRYQVIERHYALTPERSGNIDIPSIVFRGSSMNASDPRGFFSRGRAVSARSTPVHLQVKPKPAAWTNGAWLPAASLLLKDESELPDQVHVGDPITRTIRLQAQGLGFEQLPELTPAAPDGAEIYPDKSETRTRDDGNWLYGERVRKFAFVPNRPGDLTIPGISVRWWNTVANHEETSELPPHVVKVLPAPGSSPPPSQASATAVPGNDSAASVAHHSDVVPTPTPSVVANPDSGARRALWPTLAAIGFALWLITLALWWRSPRNREVATALPAMLKVDSSAHRAAFLRACSLGEFAAAERALVAWARSERADMRNAGELMAQLDSTTQRDALVELQRVRYAGAPSQGLAGHLQNAFKGGIEWRNHAQPATDAALPELYPQR